MNIEYIKTDGLLRLSSPEITAFYANNTDYVSVTIETTVNCGNNIKATVLINDVIDDGQQLFYASNSYIYINPALYGLSAYKDGVYRVSLKLSKASSWDIMQNCFFVDVTYQCKVASYLGKLLEENDVAADKEQVSTFVHMMHYSLVNGSNCGCDCDEMCQVFDELTKIIGNVTIQVGCGC